MDVSDYRKPHDGRWIFEVDDQRSVDLRINVAPRCTAMISPAGCSIATPACSRSTVWV